MLTEEYEWLAIVAKIAKLAWYDSQNIYTCLNIIKQESIIYCFGSKMIRPDYDITGHHILIN